MPQQGHEELVLAPACSWCEQMEEWDVQRGGIVARRKERSDGDAPHVAAAQAYPSGGYRRTTNAPGGVTAGSHEELVEGLGRGQGEYQS